MSNRKSSSKGYLRSQSPSVRTHDCLCTVARHLPPVGHLLHCPRHCHSRGKKGVWHLTPQTIVVALCHIVPVTKSEIQPQSDYTWWDMYWIIYICDTALVKHYVANVLFCHVLQIKIIKGHWNLKWHCPLEIAILQMSGYEDSTRSVFRIWMDVGRSTPFRRSSRPHTWLQFLGCILHVWHFIIPPLTLTIPWLSISSIKWMVENWIC